LREFEKIGGQVGKPEAGKELRNLRFCCPP
jgi:hypothetical protein